MKTEFFDLIVMEESASLDPTLTELKKAFDSVESKEDIKALLTQVLRAYLLSISESLEL